MLVRDMALGFLLMSGAIRHKSEGFIYTIDMDMIHPLRRLLQAHASTCTGYKKEDLTERDTATRAADIHTLAATFRQLEAGSARDPVSQFARDMRLSQKHVWTGGLGRP